MAIEQFDVVICGSGSAGICTALWLARCGLRCKILESRQGPLEIGQADGVQCRTVELFDSFGLVEELLRESYHVLEVTFWSSHDEGGKGIIRTGTTADKQPGLSHQPHVILNQARVNNLLIGAMQAFNGQEISYGYSVKSVEVDASATSDPEAYCAAVTASKDNVDTIFKAKYVLGCDGAHSTVRRSLGISMTGDSTESVWGVMDVYPLTNFPDIRKKVAIKSDLGSMLIVPREGGSLVRFYVELPLGTVAKEVTLIHLHDMSQQILSPYTLDFVETAWWSAYAIGQRVANQFTKYNRVFLTGDSCHTHSPKAGQGMNASLQDGYNIGWKLAAVLKRQATPELLNTYTIERGQAATNLIDFDRKFAKSFSSRTLENGPHGNSTFMDHFIASGVYTAGLSTRYTNSVITRTDLGNPALASNLYIGMRFPSVQVVRFCDALPIQLQKALPSDGRWRIVVFAGDLTDSESSARLKKLGHYLNLVESPVRRYTPQDRDIDSAIEVIVVLSGSRQDLEQDGIPEFFRPKTGKRMIPDLHKVYVDDEGYNSGHGHAYNYYNIDERKGAMVIVRPDQYISAILAPEDHDSLASFFAGFFLSPLIH
ncbi:2-polyprenyl-6-methoxyphenol hydroxylase [Cadophora sp. DSE1049]|nr:2-polyprenyl-6-methoxyphenol hydroxylase [Cadophora sp. DSE1049]